LPIDQPTAPPPRPILVTGSAGFIGFHLAERLLQDGVPVLGVDNFNAYYDVALKEARNARLVTFPQFRVFRLDLADGAAVRALFAEHRPEIVIHLAAQAGVRHSLDHPQAYVEANIAALVNILEGCRHNGCRHLVFASSSSVYGANTAMPFSVHRPADHPVSLYGATKRAGELMTHAYSHLFGLPVTGLRFFTVYGPWGRPDMALFRFTKAILAGAPIELYNEGRMRRDFTYVGDVVETIVRLRAKPPAGDPAWSDGDGDPARSTAPFRLYNVGSHAPVELNRLIEVLERALGRQAIRDLLPMQPGDVPATFAQTDDLQRAIGYAPGTPIETGVQRFVDWYRSYFNVGA
jgi:UDP-glucuronate 4-epimerase